MKQLSLLFTIAIAVTVGFIACDTTSSGGGTGTLEVSMTDAPANYDSVHVTIKSVKVISEENEDDNNEAEETDSNDGDSKWITILDEQMRINLLELTNGNQIMLGSEELEATNYSQIRLILGSNNTITVDGETYPLQTPSTQQTGIKLNIDAEVKKGQTYTLLIDFDAARSIVELGIGGFVLNPVLRTVNLAETGSLSGTVQPTDFKTNVMAVMNGDTVTSTITADNGNFKMIGLVPGNYNVIFDPDSDQYSDSTQTNIEVEQGSENNLGTIELEPNGG